MTGNPIETAVEGPLLVLTLNRPDKGNALRHEDCVTLRRSIEEVDGGTDIRAILIRAEGRHFCAGADLVAANAPGAKPRPGHMARALHAGAHGLISALWHSPVPTVSAVQGRAIGLGMHLAVACDFTIAAEEAVFSAVFCKRGFSVDSGGSYLLPRLIGLRRARQMLMRAVPVPAPTAADWGLIDSAVPGARLEDESLGLATELASGATFSLGHTKRLLNDPVSSDIDAVLAQEAASVEATIRSADFKEGIRAFVERREPVFTGV